MAETEYICPGCGYVGRPITKVEPSSFGGMILWLFLIIPGLLYTIWRFVFRREKACAKCNGIMIVPVDTPVGQKLVNEMSVEKLAATPSSLMFEEETGDGGISRVIVLLAITLAVSMVIALLFIFL